MKKHIPNIITCCNLLCGAGAIVCAFAGAYASAFLFILAGACFDFVDGATARWLGVSGPMGVELDSLADDITFGLAPAMIVYRLLSPALGYWSLLALLMAAFSAVRLAKFNIDSRQHENFIGLATPANAIFWASIATLPILPSMHEAVVTPGVPYVEMVLPWVLLAATAVGDWLMVSEVKFFSLKMKSLGWKENKWRYIFLIGCVLIIAFCIAIALKMGHAQYALIAGAACIAWYVVINVCTK